MQKNNVFFTILFIFYLLIWNDFYVVVFTTGAVKKAIKKHHW